MTTDNGGGATPNGETKQFTVYAGTQPTGPVPSGCAISQSPNTTNAAVASGTSVSLTVTCAVGMPLTSCSWTGVGVPSTTLCAGVTVAPTATTGYSVTASNSNGSASSPATTTVNVVSQAAGQNLCTSADQIINVAWPPTEQSQIQTRGFTQNTLAFKLAVPASFNPVLDPLHTGYISMVEVPGAIRTARAVSVSRNSCDLSRTNSLMYSEGGTSPAFNFAVDNPTGYANLGAAMDFQPGQVYYINVENTYKGSTTCPIGKNCDILFNFKTPNSY